MKRYMVTVELTEELERPPEPGDPMIPTASYSKRNVSEAELREGRLLSELLDDYQSEMLDSRAAAVFSMIEPSLKVH